MRIAVASVICLFGLVASASAQQWTMPGYSPLGLGGTIRDFAPRGAGFFCDDKSTGWNVQVGSGKTTVIVNGPGDRSLLKPKMIVQFKVEVDDSLASVNNAPIKEITISSGGGKVVTGFLKPPVDHTSKPVPKPAAGKWEIRGAVAEVEGDTLTLSVGPKKLTYTLDPKVKITASLSDLKYAQQGDAVRIIAWYGKGQGPNFTANTPGTCLAEKVTVTTKNTLVEKDDPKTKKP